MGDSKSYREISRLGKKMRRLEPGWSWGPREYAQRSWRGARGFPVLLKELYPYSRSTGTPLKALSQGGTWLRKTSGCCVEAGWRVQLGAMVVVQDGGGGEGDGEVAAGGEK